MSPKNCGRYRQVLVNSSWTVFSFPFTNAREFKLMLQTLLSALFFIKSISGNALHLLPVGDDLVPDLDEH